MLFPLDIISIKPYQAAYEIEKKKRQWGSTGADSSSGPKYTAALAPPLAEKHRDPKPQYQTIQKCTFLETMLYYESITLNRVWIMTSNECLAFNLMWCRIKHKQLSLLF